MKILKLEAFEVFDSNGIATLEVNVLIGDEFKQFKGKSVVPALLNTKAKEVADKDKLKLHAKGVSVAVSSINTFVAKAFYNQNFKNIADLDDYLLKLDNTADKSTLGASSLFAISTAYLKAVAASKEIAPYMYVAKDLGVKSAIPEIYFKAPSADFAFSVIAKNNLYENLRLAISIDSSNKLKDFLRFCTAEKLVLGQDINIVTDDAVSTEEQVIKLSENTAENLRLDTVSTIKVDLRDIATVSEFTQICSELYRFKKAVYVTNSNGHTEDNILAHLVAGVGAKYFELTNFAALTNTIVVNELIRIEKHLLSPEILSL